MRAGQMLFIPAGWWHEVCTPRVTLGFNFWFKPHPRTALRPTLLFVNSDLYASRVVASCQRGIRKRKKAHSIESGQRGRKTQLLQ